MDKQVDNIPLKPAQVDMMRVHVQRLQKAQSDLEAAQRVASAEQENANLFVAYCAAELGAGAAHVFDQGSMAFVQRPKGEDE